MVRDVVELLDEDKDGKLSEEEFMGYYLHRRIEFDKVHWTIGYLVIILVYTYMHGKQSNFPKNN